MPESLNQQVFDPDSTSDLLRLDLNQMAGRHSRKRKILTFSSPCPSWAWWSPLPAVLGFARALQQSFSVWTCWARRRATSSSPPASFSLPGEASSNGQISHVALEWEETHVMYGLIKEFQAQWLDRDQYLFLCLLEFSLLFLYSLNKHLPHFFFFLLQFPHELVPLGFIGLLKAGRERGPRVLRFSVLNNLHRLIIHIPADYLKGLLSGSVSLKPISSSLQRR